MTNSTSRSPASPTPSSRSKRDAGETTERAQEIAQAEDRLQTASETQSKPSPEKSLKNPLLTRKLLLMSPFTLYPTPDKKLGVGTSYDRIPGVLLVLQERDGWVWLARQDGEPLGWKERNEGSSHEWNSRLAWCPSNRSGSPPLIYGAQQDAISQTNGIPLPIDLIRNNRVFPILAVERHEDDVYVLLGPDFSSCPKPSSAFPAWIRVEHRHGSVGVVAPLPELDAFCKKVYVLLEAIQANGSNANLTNQLASLRLAGLTLTSGQSYSSFQDYTDLERLQSMRTLFPGLSMPDSFLMTQQLTTLLQLRQFQDWLRKQTDKLQLLEKVISNLDTPSSAKSTFSAREPGNAITIREWTFVSLNKIP